MARWLGFISIFLSVGWALAQTSSSTPVPAEVASAETSATPIPLTSFEQFLFNTRLDLEILADEVYGASQRPVAWTSNADVRSPSIIADLWFDNEQLANDIFGEGVRPAAWIGATSTNGVLVARNVRHDLELSANSVNPDARPAAWVGAEPFYQCSRTIMNLSQILQERFGYVSSTPTNLPNYCQALAGELEAQLTARQIEVTPSEQINALILANRGDLERIADEKLGLNNRPQNWIGNKDLTSPTLAADNFVDIERLADELLGAGERPAGWSGSISGALVVTYRNQRYDLELLANATLGADIRPRGWQGTAPLGRCVPTLQSLLVLVENVYAYSLPSAEELGTDYCTGLSNSINLLAENAPTAPAEEDLASQAEALEAARFTAESDFAFSYLDPAALDYMGQMPKGTKFRAWYRNFGESSMMFVSGDNFAVFVDRRWTTMDEDVFASLPTLENVKPLTFCDADWCNGPRATPTPTGGALFAIINQATPPATLAPGQNIDDTGKRLVSWNHIRVTYVQQRPDVRRAQVTLEICNETGQITCEPVQSILNNNTGVNEPILASVNGLNVFELPYGYSANLVISGATLFSVDVWLNDPALFAPALSATATPTP